MAISVTSTALDMEKKAIGRCARRNTCRNCLIWIYCGVILTSFTVFFTFWYTEMFRDCVWSQLDLRNGSRTFDWWQRPPFKITYNIYIFNYTNVDDFQDGKAEKLRVQELGPYTYRETMTRVNVKMHENGTVSYQEKRSYQWNGGKYPNDTVVVPNMPLMSAIAYVRDLNFAAKIGLTAVLTTLQEKAFVSETVNGILWGYDNPLFRVAKPLILLQRDIPFDKFGLLAVKNGTDRDRITINTGSQSIEKRGLVEQVNGVSSRNVWGDEQCDKIKGSEGSMFPPHLIEDTNETLYVYAKDMCRKLPFRFFGNVDNYGIPSLRYKLAADTFDSSSTQNQCFCPKVRESRACPPAGLFNISACTYDSPLLSSLPHFYLADESLLEQIDGLHPQQEHHESYIDIHPRIAVPIGGRSRLQMNLEVRRAIGVPFLGKLKDGSILPLIWIDVGVDELPQPVLEILHFAYFTLATVEACFQWCSLIILLLSAGALIAHLRKHHERKHAHLQRNLSGQNKLLEQSEPIEVIVTENALKRKDLSDSMNV